MGAISGAFAAACTTPLDVVKTQMMCSASKRPTMVAASQELWKQGGPRAFFRYGHLCMLCPAVTPLESNPLSHCLAVIIVGCLL